MNRQVTSDVQRLRLRLSLRRARDERGLTQRSVAEELGWSLSKLIRIESGQVGVSKTDLKALIDIYHIDDPETAEELIRLGKEGRRQGWSTYRDILRPEFIQFLGYEAAASACRHYQSVVVPGLLQTKDYAMAMAREFVEPGTSPSAAKRRWEVMARRQELLDNDRVGLHFILDEAVIRRWVGNRPGNPSIMRAQLRRLKELGQRPNIKIQVIPFTHGLHAGMQGAFILLQLDEVDDVLVYEEAAKGSSITRDNSKKIEGYERAFEHLARIGSPSDRLNDVIDGVLREMRAAPPA